MHPLARHDAADTREPQAELCRHRADVGTRIGRRGGDPMTGVILAGGMNSRMGHNKAFLTLEGERLIDRTARILRRVFRHLVIVTLDPFAYLDQEATLVTDILPGKGALGGLYTGLFHAEDDQAFITASVYSVLAPSGPTAICFIFCEGS